MNSSPPRSSPPPGVPRDLVARARIQTEREELGAVADARTQALLEFELGALHEHGLGDAALAAHHYVRALERRGGFRPALFALARLYAETDLSFEAARVWEALARTTRAPAEGATALCEAGLLLHDRLGQHERAVELWEEALALDPSCVTAALLLEHHHRTVPALKEARRAVELHARGLGDPELEAVLLRELAAADERAGDTDVALARLAEAAELDPTACAPWYEIERLARRHGRHDRVAAALSALAAREQGSAARSAALLCEAARVQAARCGDRDAARACYDRALELLPGDPFALWERALLQSDRGAHAAAAADARALLDRAPDATLAAAVRIRLGELLAAQGEHDASLRELAAAVAAAPESATGTAVYEDALLRAGRFEALRDHLLARAERSSGAARTEHLLRAARVALLPLGRSGNALELMEQAAGTAERREPVLRSMHTAAVFAGDSRAAIDAAEGLCQAELDPLERSLLRFDQYHRTQRDEDDGDALLPLLTTLLREPAVADWAPHAARVHAAFAGRHRLLADAHDALAARAGDDARAAAHLCAAARALARAGEPGAAAERARAALERAPADTYALALLEESLLASGDGHEAASVLREAARAHADSARRELALLHAGTAAESAGDAHAAWRAYEEAADAEPSALAPRWAMLRLAERMRDRGLLLRALERLAKRERELAGSGIANLELGELLGAQRMGEAASSPLRVALGRADTRVAAALELSTLPANDVAPALRDLAVAAFADACAGSERLSLLRDGVAVRLQTDAYAAHALAGALAAEHEGDPGLALIAFASANGDVERGQGLIGMSHATSDEGAAGELLLHGMRVALLAQGEQATEDALLHSLEAAQNAPATLAASVALDEALWAGDDAESRLLALSGRLAHASEQTRAPLIAARARALLAAGRAGEAAAAAREALNAEPDDLSLWELLRAAARARGDWESAAEAAERLAAAAEGPLRTQLLEEAAALLQNELGHNERAERCLRAAFDADPRAELSFCWLHDLLLERRDVPSLLALIERRAAVVDDPAQRLELDYEHALLLRAQGRKQEAAAALEAVLMRDPRHAAALGLLVETCTAAEQWAAAVSALQRLADADVPHAQRRLARLGAADFLERKLGDFTGACAEVEMVCALEPGDAVQRARLAALYERSARYRDAVTAYVAAAALEQGAAAAALELRAAAILSGSLGAVGEAIEACERALIDDPLNEAACGQLLEFVDGAARERVLVRFASAVERALDREPLRPELLRKLRRIGRWRVRPDMEWVALNALRALELLAEDERAELRELERARLPAQRLDTARLARVAGALAASPFARAAQAVSAALDTLAAETAHPTPAANTDLTPGAEPSPEQRFESGAAALARELGVLALHRLERAAQRSALRAALALVDGARVDDEGAAIARQLARRVTRAERKELARALSGLAQPEREIDRYLDLLAAACERAGLIVADDPRPALARIVPGGRVELETIARTPRAIDLLRFWLSDDLLELRRELGWRP